jgi:hypothetical protein
MNRRTLDLLFSAGGVVLGVMLLVLGLVLRNQANFAHNYVKDQLTAQDIKFAPATALTDSEKKVGCLVSYAGSQLNSGKKAECYANEFIGDHLKNIAINFKQADGTAYMLPDGKTALDLSGKTYATLGDVVNQYKAALKAPVAGGLTTDQLNTTITALSGTRDTMFKGETLRGLLLTSYGFSVFGDRASLAAVVCFAAFALMVLLSIAGFIHAASVKRHAIKVVEAPAGIVAA